MEDDGVSPWSKVQKMRREGVRFDQMARTLVADGLTPEDLGLLFEGQPELERPRPPYPVTPDAMKVPERSAPDGGVFGLLKKPALKGIDDFVKPGTLYESHQVQWKVQLPESATLGWGESVDSVWHVQSCSDGPRRLVIQVSGDRGALLGELSHELELSPGRIEKVVLPLRVQVLAPRRITWVLEPVVVGRGGTPLRPRRGYPWTAPPRDAIEALERAGVTVIGNEDDDAEGTGSLDGVIELRCDSSKPFADRPREVERTTVHQPTAEELKKAAGL